jgi:hypothetical protein
LLNILKTLCLSRFRVSISSLSLLLLSNMERTWVSGLHATL